jgi:chromosome partitioning protein
MSAKVIAVANTKGGVGKTTVSGNLAWSLAAGEPAQRVLLVDCDTTAIATQWFDVNAEAIPFDRVQLTTARNLRAQLARLRSTYDFVILDCPPLDAEVTSAALYECDLGLVPVQPSPLDAYAHRSLLPQLRQVKAARPDVPLRFVINQIVPNTTLAREAQESLATVEDIPLLAAHLHTRQIYRQVTGAGLSVVATSTPAKQEFETLTREVLNVFQAA